MAGKRRSFIRELCTLMPVLETEYNGQIKIPALEENNMNEVVVEITPLKGFYAHATFLFRVRATLDYPFARPAVTCLTSVFHPNIGSDYYVDNVCLNLLNEWESHFGLKDLFHALLFLFYEPNFDDRLNSAAEAEEGLSIEETIYKSLRGGPVNSTVYEPNEAWLKWSKENRTQTDCTSLGDDHAQSLSDSNMCGTYSSLLRQESSVGNYFRPALSGQFSPIIFSVFEEWPFQCMTECGVEFVYACQITINPSSLGISMHDSQRYYFIEQCFCSRSARILHLDELSTRNSSITHYGQMYASSQFTTWKRWEILPKVSPIKFELPFSDENLLCETALDGEEINTDDGSCAEDSNDGDMVNLNPAENGTVSEQDAPPPEEDILTNQVIPPDGEIYVGDGSEAVAPKPMRMESELEAPTFEDGIRPETTGHVRGVVSEQALQEDVEEQVPEFVVTTSDVNMQASEVDDENEISEIQESHWDEVAVDDGRPNSDAESEFVEYIEEQSSLKYILKGQNSSSCQLSPWWWIMYQSRWPVHLAPRHWIRMKYFKQKRCFTRASAAVLWTDLYWMGVKHNEPTVIFLVDSLSLSPLSPMVNRALTFRGPNGRSVYWCGLDWYSLWDAIRPIRCGTLSPRIHFRLPSLMFTLCYVHNWLAYMSRVELYGSCLGYSRPLHPGVLSNAASTCITPASLGCGQCSVLDMWPLWLMWRMSRQLCRLVVFLCSRSIHPDDYTGPVRTGVCFPFSDLDEL